MDGEILYIDKSISIEMMQIIGTWKTEKTMPLLGSGDGIVAIHPDGHAKGCGRVRFLGREHTFQADSIQIEQIDELQYRATYLGKSMIFFANRTATQLSMTVNPYRMGIVNIKHLDINIPLYFTRE